MFIKDNLRFNIHQKYTDPETGEHGIDMTVASNRARFGVTEIPDPARGNDEIEYTQEINEAPYIIITPKSQEQIDAQNKAKALAELTALEQANLLPRVTREFLIAVTLQQAATLGLTVAQLLDANDPAFSPGFKKMWDFNEQTKVLRGRL